MIPISAPGVYDIDIDDYHSQRACVGPSISSSGLRQLIHECPARFYAYSDLNPKRFERKDRDALNFGRAAHALALGEPEFNSKFVIAPFDEFRTGEARHWRREQTKQIVRVTEWETIQAMAEAQKRSPQCMNAFTQGAPEKSLIWRDQLGIWLKARPDWLPDDPAKRFLVEYKTAISIEPRKLSNDAFGRGYEMQAAMALDAVETVMDLNPLGMAHVVQEKEPPYLCELRVFAAEQIEWGRMQYAKAIEIFGQCLKSGEWPGYSTEGRYFETPYWVLKRMESFNDDRNAGTHGYDHHGTTVQSG